MAGPVKNFWPGSLPAPGKKPSRKGVPMMNSDSKVPRPAGTYLGFDVEKK